MRNKHTIKASLLSHFYFTLFPTCSDQNIKILKKTRILRNTAKKPSRTTSITYAKHRLLYRDLDIFESSLFAKLFSTDAP